MLHATYSLLHFSLILKNMSENQSQAVAAYASGNLSDAISLQRRYMAEAMANGTARIADYIFFAILLDAGTSRSEALSCPPSAPMAQI